MEETLSSVSELLTVEEPLCQLLPDRFTQDAACWRTSLCRCDSEGRLFLDVCGERVRARVFSPPACARTYAPICMILHFRRANTGGGHSRQQENTNRDMRKNKRRGRDTAISLLKPLLLGKHLFFARRKYIQAVWAFARCNPADMEATALP